MHVFTRRGLGIIFSVLCWCATIWMIGWCCHKYYLDEDETVVSFNTFYASPIDVYPSFSLCFTSPYDEHKLKKYGNDVTPESYGDFLGGLLWNDRMLDIDYEEVSINYKDYFVGYEVVYRDATTASNKTYEFDNKEAMRQSIPPYVTLGIPNMICFSWDFQFESSIIRAQVKIKSGIFNDDIRPGYADPKTKNRGIGVILHYPNQVMRSQFWKSTWPNRNANASKSYVTSLDLSGMEIINYRSKRTQKCTEGYPEYDQEVLKEILLSVGCRPPYVKSLTNLTLCSNKEQLRKIQDVFMERWQAVDLRHLPCRGLEKLQYDTTEYDTVENDPPTFGVEFTYKELT